MDFQATYRIRMVVSTYCRIFDSLISWCAVLSRMTDWLLQHSLEPEEIVTRYASLDIETTGIDPSNSQTVAIGIGLKDTVSGEQTVDVLNLSGAMGDEETLINRAFERINQFEPSALVTYNGKGFDLSYLAQRMDILQPNQRTELDCENNHIDLFIPRKQLADQHGAKWPSLEEVLKGHGLAAQPTMWRGKELTNRRFGEELAPEYVDALNEGQMTTVDDLETVIHEYVVGDVEANFVLYETDADRR